jgi:hypothetical protein
MNHPQELIQVVGSVPGRHRQYLEIGWHGDRVMISETDLGKRSLNRFWPHWMRQLVLDHSGKQSFGVELSNNRVLIAGGKTKQSLMGVGMHWAAQIRPLQEVIISIPDECDRNRKVWMAKLSDRYIPAMIAESIRLPRGANLSWGDGIQAGIWNLYLTREQRCIWSLSELGYSIEFQVAHACSL